jgi:diadenosine tetraphosphatase ApaH/serine/threonine PP2A family protein phosphatase
MLTAIFSDVHANLEGLTAVLEHARQRGAERYICLGDVVGYGAEPSQCIRLLRSVEGLLCLKGNHDAALLGEVDETTYNDKARTALKVHRKMLSDGEKKYLASLEPSAREGEVLFVHAAPEDPLLGYLNTPSRLRKGLESTDARLVFGGHTHQPLVFILDEKGREKLFIPDAAEPADEEPRPRHFWDILASPSSGRKGPKKDSQIHTLDRAERSIVNDGSAGQPRDGDRRASVVYFDPEAYSVEFTRVEYDVKAAQEKIRKLGLPEFLAHRLGEGI